MKEIDELDSMARSLLETEEEKLTWMIRPAVTFVGLEAFLCDRVINISISSLLNNQKNGALEVFARKLLYDLRNKRFQVHCNECGMPKATYRRKDVLREINWELKQVVQGVSKFPQDIPTSYGECVKENKEIVEFLRSTIKKYERKELLMDKALEAAINIPTRSLNLLIETGIKTLRELTRRTEDELSRIEGLGPIGVAHVKNELEKLGLELRRSESMTRSAG